MPEARGGQSHRLLRPAVAQRVAQCVDQPAALVRPPIAHRVGRAPTAAAAAAAAASWLRGALAQCRAARVLKLPPPLRVCRH